MPGQGPVVLFDKSALQTLTVDEAVWFDTFYLPSMTPLFFIETLADLEKEMQAGRSADDFVGTLAEKTPLGGAINVHHRTLMVAELFGNKVEMRRFPVVSGGDSVSTRDGRGAVVFDPSAESVALARWQDGQFLDVERQFAKDWRAGLSNLDLDAIFRKGRDLIARVGRPKDLAAVKDIASEIIAKRASRYVLQELQTLQPENLASIIVKRWQDRGCPPIASYAPYAAHVLLVDLLFCLAMGADLIGRERPSNKVDFAYLYYLPFCMVFTSRDKLHARTAPLFLADNQVFVHGDDLKADLARLNEHYLELPPEVKLRGVMSFAHYPPVEGDFLISKLWDQLMAPGWRDVGGQPPPIQSAEDTSKIISEINEMADAPRRTRVPPIQLQEAGAVIMRRRVPLHRGNWRMLPPEIEESRS